MYTSPRRKPSTTVNSPNDRLYLWLKFCLECEKLGSEKWHLSELFQICQHMHYMFTTIIQSEEQKRHQLQLIQLQQQMSNNGVPRGVPSIVSVVEPKITLEQLQLLHNSFDILQNVIKYELTAYATNFSQYMKVLSESLSDMKQFLQQQQQHLTLNMTSQNDNPIQFCWAHLTSHPVKFEAEKVIYSLSTAYYTLFNEYDLDQFYYTGLNRNLKDFSLDLSILDEHDIDDDDESEEPDLQFEPKIIPPEIKQKKKKTFLMIQSIFSLAAFVFTIYNYNRHRLVTKLNKSEYKQLGLVSSGSFILTWIVVGFFAPKLWRLYAKFLRYISEQQVVKSKNIMSPTNAPPNVIQEIHIPEMLDQLKDYFTQFIRLIKGHTEYMQQIELLLKKLNERQLFLDCTSLTPVKRQQKKIQVDQKGIDQETIVTCQIFQRVGDQFTQLSEKIKIFETL